MPDGTSRFTDAEGKTIWCAGRFWAPKFYGFTCEMHLKIIGSKHSKFARIRYDRGSEAVIFRESLVIPTCPFWILEAFSRSDQHPHGLFQPWRNDVVCHPHIGPTGGTSWVAPPSRSTPWWRTSPVQRPGMARNTHGGGIVAPFCGTCS